MNLISQLPRTNRGMRFPSHPFRVAHRPYVIQPFLIAPVIPGDTLKGLAIKGRALTKASSLDPFCGHWLTHRIFYVRLNDFQQNLDVDPDGDFEPNFGLAAQDLQQMLVDPANTKLGLLASDTYPTLYTAEGTAPYVEECLKRVTRDFFRDQSEKWDNFTATENGYEMPIAPIRNMDWLDSAIDVENLPDQVDMDVDLNADNTITASELEEAQMRYHALIAQGGQSLSYEEYLRMKFGQRLPKQRQPHAEELMTRTLWQVPSNTVNPADGSVQTAISWQIDHTMKSPKIFREPGFIFGVTCDYRKEYRDVAKVAGNAAGTLWRSSAWLGDMLMLGPQYSLERLTTDGSGTDLLPATKETSMAAGDGVDVLFDYKDLYCYGDQFVYDPSSSTEPVFAGPDADLRKRYHDDSVVEALPYVVQDGVVMLQISSTISDTSQLEPDPAM